MAGDKGNGASRQLDQTPTWAVAGVCAIIILISIALEKILHKVGTVALEAEPRPWHVTFLSPYFGAGCYNIIVIFLMGIYVYSVVNCPAKAQNRVDDPWFHSLSLVFCQYYIARICISEKLANHMLPCALASNGNGKQEEHQRKLLAYGHRSLADIGMQTCKEGQVVLISVDGLHQIHILIFFLAVIHVVYSAVTMALGRLKIRGWKEWEKETLSHNYEFSNDPSRFRLTHETTFVKAHTSFWTRIPSFFYIVHLAPASKFNFQQYIKRSLDFKKVVGVSPVLWASFVVYLLINISGWHALFWASIVPVIVRIFLDCKVFTDILRRPKVLNFVSRSR